MGVVKWYFAKQLLQTWYDKMQSTSGVGRPPYVCSTYANSLITCGYSRYNSDYENDDQVETY